MNLLTTIKDSPDYYQNAAHEAAMALTRLDERLAHSSVGGGTIERLHYLDACASLWIDGELVHLEDLVLHDAAADIRAPTHEVTIAHSVLRARRRIACQPAGWALSKTGLRTLVGQEGREEFGPKLLPVDEDELNPLADELAAIDAVLARSNALLAGTRLKLDYSVSRQDQRGPLVYDMDWNENERLAQWQKVLSRSSDLPPVLRAAVIFDAWKEIEVLQHCPWLGRLLAAACLGEAGMTTGAHLATFNLGLKAIPRERRAHRKPEARLVAILDAITAAAEAGFKEHSKLLLAQQVMDLRLAGLRRSSHLPALADLVLSKPVVSTELVARVLGIEHRSALRLINQLKLREFSGRGRYRVWGIL